ncbi:UbiA family prenyltransferase [Streptomyces violaceus]|uniref:UbiA family prenyltransferase n=1 Tax=Streptomyces violaceus TaxID=1936 RepID=UPI00380EE913
MPLRDNALVAQPARFALDLLILTRPIAALCSGAQVVVGGNLTGRLATTGDELVLLRAGFAIMFVVATVNVVNDIVDVRADAINRSGRPLPAGRVSTATAWRLAVAHAALSFACAVGVPGGVAVIATLLCVGLYYDYVLKSTVLVGNIVVAILAATPIVFGGRLADVEPLPLAMTASIIFLFMFAFEVLKTIRDVEADRAAGYQTAATELGRPSTSLIFRLTLTVYAAAAVVPVLLPWVSLAYAAFMLPGAVLPSLATGWLLPVGRSAAAERVVRRVMVVSWFPGLAAFALAFRP